MSPTSVLATVFVLQNSDLLISEMIEPSSPSPSLSTISTMSDARLFSALPLVDVTLLLVYAKAFRESRPKLNF
jgi:hypothetical protein